MIAVKVIPASGFRILPKADDGIRSQPFLFGCLTRWVNTRPPKRWQENQAADTRDGVETTVVEVKRYGVWVRFRKLRTIRRNLICWQREVMV